MDFKLEHEVKFKAQIFDARFHPNNENDLVAVVTINGNVQLLESGVSKFKIRKHHKGSPIRKVRFTNDGRLVTIAKTVKIYDLVANQTLHTLKRNDENIVTFYSVKPFGHNIVSAGDDDGNIFVWDTRTPEEPIFSSQDCEQYISDIDGKFESRRLMLCTSGEGTLTAYDLRANKMIEPQSELFEAGFQCVKQMDLNNKVVIGGEDGSIYVFNHNEWAHTSGKFPLSNDTQNSGKCSIDCIDLLPDSSIFLAGCSDGKLRSLTLWPHQTLSENVFCKRTPLESVHVNPNDGKSTIVISGENYINVVSYEEKGEPESDDDEEEACNESNKTAAAGISEGGAAASGERPPEENAQKKLKADTEDYLKVFN